MNALADRYFGKRHFLRKEDRPPSVVQQGHEDAYSDEEARKLLEEGPTSDLAKENPMAAGVLGAGKITGLNNMLSNMIRKRQEESGRDAARKYEDMGKRR